MAIVYPDDPKLQGSEPVVLDQLQAELNDNWHIFANFEFRQKDSHSTRQIDFIVANSTIPGFIAIEVKGGRVNHEYGKWTTRDGAGIVRLLDPPPHKQAKSAMDALSAALNSNRGPESTVDGSRKSDWADWLRWAVIIIDPTTKARSDLKKMGKCVISLRENLSSQLTAILPRHPSRAGTEICDRINMLKEWAEAGYARNRLITFVNGHLVRVKEAFSEQEKDWISLLCKHRRLVVTGPAGTGKTVMALNAARRCAADGLRPRRVLYLCKNRHLQRAIMTYARTEPGRFQAFTYERLLGFIEQGKLKPSWDGIFLDEAQDFERSEFEEVVRWFARGNHTTFWAFCDDYQSLRLDEQKMVDAAFLRKRLTWVGKVLPAWMARVFFLHRLDRVHHEKLTHTYRNTKEVATFAYKNVKLEVTTSESIGIDIEEKCAGNLQELANIVIDKIYYWIGAAKKEGGMTAAIDPNSVALLSATGDDLRKFRINLLCATDEVVFTSYFSNDMSPSAYGFKPISQGPVVWSSVEGFKGLEADAVLLLVQGKPPFEDQTCRLLYVGGSRARLLLTVVYVHLAESDSTDRMKLDTSMVEAIQNVTRRHIKISDEEKKKFYVSFYEHLSNDQRVQLESAVNDGLPKDIFKEDIFKQLRNEWGKRFCYPAGVPKRIQNEVAHGLLAFVKEKSDAAIL